jgi:23S rRNA (cytidine1920-2'-O)/16S rRNA (cytidine1409-2'-O)-methyltransferase
MAKKRVDDLLCERGLAPSLEKARAMLMAGLVSSGGERVTKAGTLLGVDRPLEVRPVQPYVSRAGAKLAGALDAFGIDPSGRIAADIGASTGGFTDCLLERGARRVYAVDVDTKQIDRKLRADPRVVLVEKNARSLVPGDLPGPPEIVAMDVSFISVLKIIPALEAVLAPAGVLVVLVKPQFEAPPARVGKGGIVRDPAVRAEVLERVIRGASGSGFVLDGLVRSSVRGRTGNVEFLALFSRRGAGIGPEARAALIQEVIADA